MPRIDKAQSVRCPTVGCGGYMKAPREPKHLDDGSIERRRVCVACGAQVLTVESIVREYSRRSPVVVSPQPELPFVRVVGGVCK